MENRRTWNLSSHSKTWWTLWDMSFSYLFPHWEKKKKKRKKQYIKSLHKKAFLKTNKKESNLPEKKAIEKKYIRTEGRTETSVLFSKSLTSGYIRWSCFLSHSLLPYSAQHVFRIQASDLCELSQPTLSVQIACKFTFSLIFNDVFCSAGPLIDFTFYSPSTLLCHIQNRL